MQKKSTSLTELPLRPGLGDRGTPTSVQINIFPISIMADARVYQYDVTFQPDIPPTKTRKFWDTVEQQVRQSNSAFSKMLMVYDGRKLAYSTMDLGTKGLQVRFPYDDPKEPELKVQLKRVAIVDFHELLLFIQGKGPETDHVLHAMTCLSTVLNHIPSMLYVPIGSSVYSPSHSAKISGGLEVYHGFHQSLRALMAGHLGVNVDIASTVFLQGDISFVDLAVQMLEVKDLSQLSRIPNLIRRIQSTLKGINVVTTHRGDLKQRFKIASFSDVPADKYSFEVDGKSMTIVQYFQEQYNIKLKYPWLPVAVKANKRTAFPLEVLKVLPSQRFMKKLNPQQVSDMIKVSTKRPRDRFKEIQNAVQSTLKYQNNEYLNSFGLKVSNQMMTVPARILPTPNLRFGQNKSVPGKDGVWNLKGLKMTSTPNLISYSFVFFVNVQKGQAEAIRDNLIKKWENVGMQIKSKNAPIFIANPSNPNVVGNTLRGAYKAANDTFGSRCQLIVCVIDPFPKGIYQEIKKLLLTEAGVISQCLQFKHVRNPNEIKDQYAANLALKVNIKIGGSTNTVDHLPYFERPTLLVGADVTHPSPGSEAPSIAAVAFSLDKDATKYHTILRAQESRTEIIVDMESVIGQSLDRFHELNRIYPERIIFFRDGVSTGQFAQVRASEIYAIKKALHTRGLDGKTKLLFLVIQKRHHFRLFPLKEGDADRSGNCKAGTVIDAQVTHPFEYNFILQSHSGIQGTSRPAIYHVLHDELNVKPNELQQLCYNLCFLSERATRSISMAAPAYRAHIAAYYGRMLIEGEGNGGKIRFKNVVESMTKMMYYM